MLNIQYLGMTTLFDVVERINLEKKEIDSIFRNKSRHMINLYAKEGLSRLGMSFALNIHGWTVNVPASCKLEKPSGYKEFIRASILDCDGRLIEITRNDKIPKETFAYLTNCDGTILQDKNNALEACVDGSVCTPSNDVCVDCGCKECDCDYVYNPMYTKEVNQMIYDAEKYKNSWVKASNDSEFFTLSSDLEGLVIFIEYYADQTKGLDECAIKVDDSLSLALEYWIKYRLLEGGQETMQQAEYFKNKFKAEANNQKVKKNALVVSKLYEVLFK